MTGFVTWRLNEPIEERYRPTKIHSLNPTDDTKTICGLSVPEFPYDIDWSADPLDDGDGSCAKCRRILWRLR
jgi:hypothetical protein